MSVAAFHKHHSSNEKSFSARGLSVVLVRVSFCTSHQLFSGTKKSTLASMPSFAEVMRV